MWQAGATLHRGARAPHYRGLSCCGAQAPDAQAQQLWLTGPVAPRHAGSSQTRARTRVPCIGRQILNHCATREAQRSILTHVSLMNHSMAWGNKNHALAGKVTPGSDTHHLSQNKSWPCLTTKLRQCNPTTCQY